MHDTLPAWVQDAARLPLAFAQVREDPLLDIWVLEQLDAGARVLLVASGGCTAAALAASGRAARLHLVDPNPAQIALARLKLHLLQNATPEERLALLGHAPLEETERTVQLTQMLHDLGLAPEALGPPAIWAALGPDHAGRYERVFAALRAEFGPWEQELLALLQCGSAAAAARSAPATPLGQALDEALDKVMALPNLIALFGEGATRNRVEPFAHHFARRTRHAVATLPPADNPYLWQMYRGHFPPQSPYPWLAAPNPRRDCEVSWSVAFMTAALQQLEEMFDFIHLSNILDWLAPAEATATLELAAAALRPGGWIFIRQLNSTLDIPALGSAFAWQAAQAAALHARDRSFFYRALHLGRRR